MAKARSTTLRQIDRKAFFNQVALGWDEKFCTEELEHFLTKLVPEFNLMRGQRVLDLGTGTGVLIPHLAQAVGLSGSIVAVDFSEKMVEICRERFSSSPNIAIELQNVEELDFRPDFFDAITCFGLFPHIENKEKALCKMNLILRQEGKLIIAHALSRHEIKKHHNRAPLPVTNDTLPKEERMRQLLDNAGFTTNYIRDKQGCYLCMATKKIKFKQSAN